MLDTGDWQKYRPLFKGASYGSEVSIIHKRGKLSRNLRVGEGGGRGGAEAVFSNFKGAQDQFQGIDSASLCSLVGRYDNPITTPYTD